MTLRHHATATVATALICWATAAMLVVAAHQFFESISPAASLIAKILAILAVAFVYMRLMGREVTIDEALFVGVAWAILAIIAEVVASARLARGWFVLVGSPAHDTARIVLLLGWIVAPAVFARKR